MNRLLGTFFLSCVLFGLVTGQTRDYTHWVDPFIGTGGHGHTFPGATMPFGMVQLSPDTRGADWDGSSGYHYSDDTIYGFSHTHLSGTGIPDYCDILFMPRIGNAAFFSKAGAKDINGDASLFSHGNEHAEPGYYSVRLDDDSLLAEMTATSRVGMHRYTFPQSEKATIVVDLTWRDRILDSELKIVADNRIEGFRRSSSWAKDQTIYFVAEFSRRFQEISFGPGGVEDKRPFGTNISISKKVPKCAVHFRTREGGQILIKVGISSVSIEGARKNLEAELPGWDFDKVRADAKAAWNKELSKIEVSGGTDAQMTTFYTALYHTMIHPNIFNDVDGNYRGMDGKIYQLPDYAAQPPYLRRSSASPKRANNDPGGSAARPAAEEGRQSRKVCGERQRKSRAFPQIDGQSASREDYYTVFSLWDTFRAEHPLLTIIDQKRTVDFINTFIRMYERGGRLPVWELAGNETDTMIGYHAVCVIADAMAKGIKGFDYEKAYEAAKHSAELDRDGLAAYKRRGYISGEDDNESVSKTLEYAYDDWCIMSMGALLFNTRSFATGKNPDNDKYLKDLAADIEYYKRRAGNFQNLFDPETSFFRPKRNGGFMRPFAPEEVTFDFTEGNAWQYSFFVPHDVSRLMQLMGGPQNFIRKLDDLFTTGAKLSGREQPDITGLIGQYAHGNEPSHHIAYLYDYAGAPSKTQKRVRQIMDEFYKPTPDGLIGNEDCGQMSAWYVLSASGFYPVLPGQTRYDLGTPLFKEVVFNLENGKRFIIRAPKVSATNIYIQSAKLNGRPHDWSYIVQEQIMSGGVLELDMGDKPNDKVFSSYSISSVYQEQLAVPIIEGERVFASSTSISMRSLTPTAVIRYTLDGTDPDRSSTAYSSPIHIDQTTKVKAAVFLDGELKSHIAEATFSKRANDWTVKLTSQYSSQYPGGGDDAIIDGLRGNANFAAGEWQGYWGKPFEAIIDLRRETEIRSVGGSFLQSARSWIWMPANIKFELSIDGRNWSEVSDIKTGVPLTEMEPVVKEFSRSITPVKARYVRVIATNIGKIPAWHPGAGGEPWIFVDEILIK